ncbi:hypothetical protein [Paenirhodobacter sp.]|uniref:hypothetical protein n=1 Tax=Paenirhodobacter sp. TaxID=1965326 RepID=UPI003B3C0C3F
MQTETPAEVLISTRPSVSLKRWRCFAVLDAQIDTSAVNLAMRPIGANLNVGIGVLQWIVGSYNLVHAVLLLTGGLLADLSGRRRIFPVASLLYAVDRSLPC